MAAVQEHNLAMAALAWRLLSAKRIPGTALQSHQACCEPSASILSTCTDTTAAAGLTWVSADPTKRPEQAAPLLAFGLPGNITSGDFETAMFAQNIVVKSTGGKIFPEEWGRIGKPGVPPYATRLSFHVFNSEEDVRRMVDAIDSFLRK